MSETKSASTSSRRSKGKQTLAARYPVQFVCDQCVCPTLKPGLHQRCFRTDKKGKAKPCCQALCASTGTRCQRSGKWAINVCPFFGNTGVARWMSRQFAHYCRYRFGFKMIDFDNETCCQLCSMHARDYLRRMLTVIKDQWALKKLSRAVAKDMMKVVIGMFPGLVDADFLDAQIRAAEMLKTQF